MEGEGFDSVYDFVVDDPLYSALLQTDLSIKNDAYIFFIFPPYNAIFEDINTSNIYDVWNRNVESIGNGYIMVLTRRYCRIT